MEDSRRGWKPPLEVQRAFTSGRLEIEVLTQTYELVVPVIRKPVPAARTLWDLIEGRREESFSQRLARGA